MSIIVKGMKIPVSGTKYQVVEDMKGNKYLTLLEGNRYLTLEDFLNKQYYPISPMPEKHGRLIDGDELADGCDDPHWCRWLSEIEAMPTIVEAEGD